jgi:hypothetical protein
LNSRPSVCNFYVLAFHEASLSERRTEACEKMPRSPAVLNPITSIAACCARVPSGPRRRGEAEDWHRAFPEFDEFEAWAHRDDFATDLVGSSGLGSAAIPLLHFVWDFYNNPDFLRVGHSAGQIFCCHVPQ